MPNRKLHRSVGLVSGGIAAGVSAANRNSNVLLEAVGGAFGGLVGSALPDVIDPPTSPRHRSVGHGMAHSAVAFSYLMKAIPEWQERLRARAARELAAADAATSESSKFGHTLTHVLLLLAAGAVMGVAVGYASHLIMDAATARGLPFVA